MAPTTTAEAARDYANCTALDMLYPHRVGKLAQSRTSGERVSASLARSRCTPPTPESYADSDGVACERQRRFLTEARRSDHGVGCHHVARSHGDT